MVASRIVVLTWLALAGLMPEAGAEVRRVVGDVVEADGRPARGAEVLVAGEGWGDGPEVKGRATADAEGRFSIPIPSALDGRDRPTLWAIRPGSGSASRAIDPEGNDGRPIRLTLVRPGPAEFVVKGPEGRAVAGARVVPTRLARPGLGLPGDVGGLASATTDAEGRATLPAFRGDEVLAVRVEADGFGAQVRDFAQADGSAAPGPKSIRLAGVGRVEGRLTGDDPKSLGGRTIHLNSSTGGRPVGFAEARTDASGRFAVPALAAGVVSVRVRAEEGSPDLGARVVRYLLAEGGRVEAELALRRAVRVAGVVRDSSTAEGVAGAVVAVVSPRLPEPRVVRSDAQGRYETFLPPGPASHRVLRVPGRYLSPPIFMGPRPVAVPPAIALFELPPIELARGDQVRGRVVDAAGRGVPGARVEASWTMVQDRERVPRSAEATSRPDGSFVVGPVAPGVELTLVATLGTCDGDSVHSAPVVARASAGGSATLTTPEADAVAPIGRVVDATGRPVPGALVRIGVLVRSASGSVDATSIAHFGGHDELRCDAQGRFHGPRTLRRDREYRALGAADGHLAGRTHYRKPGPGAALEFPDLVLVPEAARVVAEGRVLDRQGRPVAGARVQSWAPGAGRARVATTGPDGRFRLEGVADRDGFVFAGRDGFRSRGRAFDPDLGPVDLTLARRGDSPDAPLTGRAGGPDLDRARAVLGPYLDAVLARGDDATKIRVLERLAAVDPARALRLVEDRAVADPWFADHLRAASALSLLGSDAAGALPAIEAIRDASARVAATLEAAGPRPGLKEEARAGLIDRAARDARSIADPDDRVTALALVAERLADSGELERARALLEEARPAALALPCATSGGRARAAFARALARFAPAQALELTEDIVDPLGFDRARIAIAVALGPVDPEGAGRALASLRDPKSLGAHLPEIARALARSDPDRARGLIARGAPGEGCLPPYALGMMALAVAATDRPKATAWLLEAFDRLEDLARAEHHGSSAPPAREPSCVAASLLPVAEAIDPALVPELFWRALALHDPAPDARPGAAAVLALLLGRYDRSVGLAILEPLACRASCLPEADLIPLIAAASALDPDLAVRLIAALPDAPDLAFHHPKNESTLALAAALARPTADHSDDAVDRFLDLWTPSASPGE